MDNNFISYLCTPESKKENQPSGHKKSPWARNSVYKRIAAAPPLLSSIRKGKAFLPIIYESKKEIKKH